MYTCNEVAQGESTTGLVEVSLSVTRDEVTYGKDVVRERRGRVEVEAKKVLSMIMTTSSE